MFEEFNKSILRSLIRINDPEIAMVCKLLRMKGSLSDAKSNQIAEKCLIEAKNGIKDSQYLLSKIYKWGLMCDANPIAGKKWCNKAYNHNHIAAAFDMAMYCDIPELGDNDNHKMISYLVESSEMNYIPSLLMLGSIYDLGVIVLEDKMKSYDYYEKASKLGSPHAKLKIANLLLRSESAFDEENGLKFLIELTTQDFPDAHFMIAYFYMDGSHGLEMNQEKVSYHLSRRDSSLVNIYNKCLGL